MKYRIEQDAQTWLVVILASDGITDVISDHATKAEAKAACEEANRETSGDERHYWAQYAYACGYHD